MTDAGNANAGAKRGTPRWVLVALFVSLALNLIVVGSVAGAVWRFRAPPVWATAVTPNLLGYASTLPPERRKHIWDQTVEERRHIRPFRRDVRAAPEPAPSQPASERLQHPQLCSSWRSDIVLKNSGAAIFRCGYPGCRTLGNGVPFSPRWPVDVVRLFDA